MEFRDETHSKWLTTIDFESWTDFKSHVSDHLLAQHREAAYGDLVYRGQGHARWSLTASLDRLLKDVPTQVRQEAHKVMLSSFRERAKGDSPLPALDAEVLALMQHYGAPTRLLDWSRSPYVAAFFAFSSTSWIAAPKDENEDPDRAVCAIYALNRKSPALAAGAGVENVVTDVHRNLRAYHQWGSYTMNMSLYGCLEDYFSNYFSGPNLPEPTLWKFELPREQASIALRDLEMMGITSESLYLGWEGSARYAFFRAIDAVGLLA
ncbi:MAG: FRG domain-containing protein [Jatrophihabitantaceae bacterium]